MRKRRGLLVGVVFVCVLSGIAATAQDTPAALFQSKCAMCHGPEGNASTPMAKNMGLKPLTGPEVQKMSDAQLATLITNGKGKMPALKGKLTDDQIASMVKYIRSLK